MRRIYLIDCPGVVPVSARDSDTDTVLKGVVRVENLATPAEHIPALLERVRPEYMERTYGLEKVEGGWHGEEGSSLLLTALARKSGKLMKGGEADQEAAAKMILNDWIRGKIPYFVAPPSREGEGVSGEEPISGDTEGEREVMERQEKRLGELLGEKRVKGVSQGLKGVITSTKFAGEDVRRIEEEEVDVEDEDDDMEDDDDDEEEEEGDDEGDKDEEMGTDDDLAWEDVFPDAGGPSKIETLLSKSTASSKSKSKQPVVAPVEDVEESEDDEEEEAEEEEVEAATTQSAAAGSSRKRSAATAGHDDDMEVTKKEKRMTTNKKKATNFFTTAVSFSSPQTDRCQGRKLIIPECQE